MDPLQSTHDLVLERVIDIPPAAVWKAWTDPATLMTWFCPAPWKTIDCEMDLRPGGIFRTVMASPDGASFPNVGCFLEIVPNERLVWTGALLPGYRPAVLTGLPFSFTAIISMAPEGSGTRYTARVMHADEAGAQAHAAMGFHTGWGIALDQLVAGAKR